MLINTIYVNGGTSIVSLVTGLHDCDGMICIPFLVFTEDDIEIIDIEKELGGA